MDSGTSWRPFPISIIFYMCGIYFAHRSGGEHRSLRLSPPQITVHKSNEGSQYLLYVEDTSKNHQGGLKQRKVLPKRVKHFANTKNPSRCFVRLFQLYISKLSMECPQDSFYFKPLQKWSSSGVWFSKQPIGHNKFHTMMSTICSAAGIGGYKTNHSLRATSATRLYHQGIDEQLIMERTGHHSIEGVRSYKRTDEKQEENISNLLQEQHQTQVANHHQIIGSLPQLQLQNCTGITINIKY